jgi:hypothetical protein
MRQKNNLERNVIVVSVPLGLKFLKYGQIWASFNLFAKPIPSVTKMLHTLPAFDSGRHATLGSVSRISNSHFL